MNLVTLDTAHASGLREPLERIARDIDASFDALLPIPTIPAAA